ncbi:MAG: diphosphate--fructose-6-phosphate 1-phosphotransferase [Actinobacteria bacterium]|nr:diphosphate--fructose-6-phosphate 1-phosphotransferase [Actinomycetota bacterium]
MKVNALVALGGGPSPVINSSLLGVVERCMQYDKHIGAIYGARHGIEGIMTEELIDMKRQDPVELSLLKDTPASGSIGTCRYKLDDNCMEDFQRIIDVISAHNIGYFFYIGGNDSMDTADKISELAKKQNMGLVVAGIPKTIDNDLGDEEFTIIDHTPGYGSTARYWANLIQDMNQENMGMCVSENVCVIQAMGRKSGFITAAARLADPKREMPLQLYFAESGHNLETLTDNVNKELRRSGRCMVVVNEGFDAGSLGEVKDGFGHIEYGASRMSAAQAVINHLNSTRLAVRGHATAQVPNVIQRSNAVYRSKVDIDEAYEIGAHAVEVALKDGTGFMATNLRNDGKDYSIRYSKIKLATVANSQRFLPESWIAPGGIDVTQDFIEYARPLIGDGWSCPPVEKGLQRFAILENILVEKKLDRYIPVKMRS